MAGKKSFATQQNPALAFISAQEPLTAGAEEQDKATNEQAEKAIEKPETASAVKTTDAPAGYKANPLFVETKSRRMQLLVQPSLYEAIKAKAAADGQSVNECVHSILEAAIREG